MKKPKKRWPALRRLFPASLGLWLLGCAGTGPRCVPPAPEALSPPNPTAPSPLHWTLSGGFRKGMMELPFEGDLLFVPPDTCRINLRSAWGQTLVDLKAFGDSLCLFTPDRVSAACSAPASAAVRRGLSLFSAVAAGILPALPAKGVETRCTPEGLLVVTDSLKILLDTEGRRVRRVEPLFFPLRLEIAAPEKTGELPGGYRLFYREESPVDIHIEKRLPADGLSGRAILK